MVCSRVDFAFATRAHDVARAILIGAEEGAAAMNFLLLARFGWIVGRGWTLRVARDASHCGESRVIVRTIPVAGPLPDVAGHVIEAVAVWWILCGGRDADVAVVTRVRA